MKRDVSWSTNALRSNWMQVESIWRLMWRLLSKKVQQESSGYCYQHLSGRWGGGRPGLPQYSSFQ